MLKALTKLRKWFIIRKKAKSWLRLYALSKSYTKNNLPWSGRLFFYCTFIANIAVKTIIANKAKKNFFCICTMLNFHKHSSFLQSCPIWRTENKKKGHITAGVITVKPKFCLIPIVLYNIFFVFSIILTHL